MMEVFVKVEDKDPSFLSLGNDCSDVKQINVEVVPKEENSAEDGDATLPGYSDMSQQVAMVNVVFGAKVQGQGSPGLEFNHPGLLESSDGLFGGGLEPEETGDRPPSYHRTSHSADRLLCSQARTPRTDHGENRRLLPVLSDPHDASSSDALPRKPDLMDKLHEKARHQRVNLSGEVVISEEQQQQRQRRLSTLLGNRNAAKHTRLIEFGWMHNGRQVRSRNGGGTRRLVVSKNAAYDDLFRLGKELFFPEGSSSKGLQENFSFNIQDYSGTEMPRQATVGALYEPLKHGMLRLYLCSLDRTEAERETKLDSGSESGSSENVSSPTRPQPGRPHSMATLTLSLPEVGGIKDSSDFAHEVHGYSDESNNFELEVVLAPPSFKSHDHHHALNGDSAHRPPGDSQQPPHIHVVEVPPLPKRARGEACRNTALKALRLWRVNIAHDMVKHFKDPGIVDAALSVTFLGESGIGASRQASSSPSFANESGVDAAGATSAREAYSSFWASFLQTNAAAGKWERVPSLRPDRGKGEWEAAGRVLLKGYQDLGFFPTSLALPFTVCLLHGEEALTPDMLIKSLLRLTASPDRDILQAALDGDTFQIDGLLDVLHRMRVGTLPDGGGIKDVVARLAHNQFIQEPMYALVRMASTAQMGLKRLLPTVAAVAALYNSAAQQNTHTHNS